jgi:hypothetical protein
VFIAEEELAVQVAQINGIQIDNVNFAKAGEEEILQQFTSDTTGTHQQGPRLRTITYEIE